MTTLSWNCSSSQSTIADFCWVTVQCPYFLQAVSAIVMDFLTSLPWIVCPLLWSFTSQLLTHAHAPSTTGHGNAGNNWGQLGLHLTPHICKAFHGPHRPAWVSQQQTSCIASREKGLVSHVWDMEEGSQGVFQEVLKYNFLGRGRKVTWCSHTSYSEYDILKFSFLVVQNWAMIRLINEYNGTKI